MNEPEYERIYDANKPQHKAEYAFYLWETGRRGAFPGHPCAQQSTSRQAAPSGKRFPLPEKKGWKVWEETRYSRWEIYRKPDAIFSIPERVLRATSTQASDWQERHGARPRQPQDERDAERARPLALQRVCEGVQGDREPSDPWDANGGHIDQWDSPIYYRRGAR